MLVGKEWPVMAGGASSLADEEAKAADFVLRQRFASGRLSVSVPCSAWMAGVISHEHRAVPGASRGLP